MSFLKQLLNPFIEFDEKKKSEPVKVQPASTVLPAKPGTMAVSPVVAPHHPLINPVAPAADIVDVPTYSPSGIIKDPLPEHKQYFEKLIDNANINNPLFHGADFKEFVDSKVDIDDIADESIKYSTAFNVLKASGLTKEKLLSTGQEYLDLVGRDLNAFQGAHALQYKKELGSKESQIRKKAEELQSLTQRLNQLKTEINQLTKDINIVKEKLDTTRSSFLLAGENKQNEIQSELNKISKYF